MTLTPTASVAVRRVDLHDRDAVREEVLVEPLRPDLAMGRRVILKVPTSIGT